VDGEHYVVGGEGLEAVGIGGNFSVEIVDADDASEEVFGWTGVGVGGHVRRYVGVIVAGRVEGGGDQVDCVGVVVVGVRVRHQRIVVSELDEVVGLGTRVGVVVGCGGG